MIKTLGLWITTKLSKGYSAVTLHKRVSFIFILISCSNQNLIQTFICYRGELKITNFNNPSDIEIISSFDMLDKS